MTFLHNGLKVSFYRATLPYLGFRESLGPYHSSNAADRKLKQSPEEVHLISTFFFFLMTMHKVIPRGKGLRKCHSWLESYFRMESADSHPSLLNVVVLSALEVKLAHSCVFIVILLIRKKKGVNKNLICIRQ